MIHYSTNHSIHNMSTGYYSDDETPFQLFDLLHIQPNVPERVVKANIINTSYDKTFNATEDAREEILNCIRQCFQISQSTTLFITMASIVQLSITHQIMTFKTADTPITPHTTNDTLIDLCRYKSSRLDYKISIAKQPGIAHICSIIIYIQW